MAIRGPLALFTAWALHDVEEALTFPDTCDHLADELGIDGIGAVDIRMDHRQSWAAVGLMGGFIGAACLRGAAKGGRSKLYRGVVAGLEGHVATHLLSVLVQRRYTAGALTAVPVMLPGATVARREIEQTGEKLRLGDYLRGAAILAPAALACHVAVRLFMPKR